MNGLYSALILLSPAEPWRLLYHEPLANSRDPVYQLLCNTMCRWCLTSVISVHIHCQQPRDISDVDDVPHMHRGRLKCKHILKISCWSRLPPPKHISEESPLLRSDNGCFIMPVLRHDCGQEVNVLMRWPRGFFTRSADPLREHPPYALIPLQFGKTSSPSSHAVIWGGGVREHRQITLITGGRGPDTPA